MRTIKLIVSKGEMPIHELPKRTRIPQLKERVFFRGKDEDSSGTWTIYGTVESVGTQIVPSPKWYNKNRSLVTITITVAPFTF